MRIVLTRAPARCAVCHDGLAGPTVLCAGCGALGHADCWADLGRCPSLGCSVREGAPPTAPRPRRRLRAGLLGLGAAAATSTDPTRGGVVRALLPLLGLLVGVSLLGLLAAVVTVPVLGQGHRARVQRVAADMKAINDALDLFRVDCGHYPPTLDALWIRPAHAQTWGPEPYLREYPPKDTWGNDYQYRYRSEACPELVSLGADGLPGGEEEGTDLSSRTINDEWTRSR